MLHSRNILTISLQKGLKNFKIPPRGLSLTKFSKKQEIYGPANLLHTYDRQNSRELSKFFVPGGYTPFPSTQSNTYQVVTMKEICKYN
jgi:hypothetical protein